MKYFKYMKSGLLAATFLLAGSLLTACEDDIDINLNDGGFFENVEGKYGYVKNVTGAQQLTPITFFGTNPGNVQLFFELSQASTEAVNVQFKVDKDALDAYNEANGTSYTMYPEANISFANSGNTSVAANATKSETVNITINPGGTIGQTYALPISAEVTSGGVALSKTNESYIFLVKPMGAIPDSDKGTGIKSILYVEVNDENILNAGEFTMKSSGKPFFDVVNIFAANINYNAETGRVNVYCNDNVSYVLRNADKFIRPLQAKGIKVCLTILGNHDEAGIANMSPAAAADFARELRNYVDLYGLDGIDFDDEYSAYKTENPGPGLEVPSQQATARLMYECRQAMPDKILSFYDYTKYIPTGSVEGIPVGELLDYGYWGLYATWSDRHETITGFTKKDYCPFPINLSYTTSNGGTYFPYTQRMKDEGYGIQMFYNIKSRDYDYTSDFNKFGEILFNDGVNWTGRIFEKTDFVGEVTIPSYESYLGTWTLKPSQGLYWYTPGPWWDWTDRVEYTIRVEQNVAGQNYKVYGWAETGDDLPFIMNYTAQGRVEINLPQVVKDSDNVEWTYVGRYNYGFSYFTAFTEEDVEPAFSGWIKSDGSFTMRGRKFLFPYNGSIYTQMTVKTMAPVQYDETRINDIYGGLRQDVAYEPYRLSR